MIDGQTEKVFIRNADGSYLSGGGMQWGFTNERMRATVFDYERDRVAEQLEGIRKTHGIVLVTVPVELKEIHEACDECEQLVAPSRAFFDGKGFLCVDCRGNESAV